MVYNRSHLRHEHRTDSELFKGNMSSRCSCNCEVTLQKDVCCLINILIKFHDVMIGFEELQLAISTIEDKVHRPNVEYILRFNPATYTTMHVVSIIYFFIFWGEILKRTLQNSKKYRRMYIQ